MAEQIPGLPKENWVLRIALYSLAGFGGLAVFGIGFAAVSSLVGDHGAAPVAAAEPPPPAPARPSSVAERLVTADLLTALALLRPMLHDSSGLQPDPGSELFVNWAAVRLAWADLSSLQATSFSLAMKDPELERGKYICTSPRVMQIRADRSLSRPVYRGTMNLDGSAISYVAVGSTGTIVEGHVSRFCGVVMGTWVYSNLGGGMTESVYLVGMFDLPENKLARQPIAKPANRP